MNIDFDKYKDNEINSLEDLKLQQICIASNIAKGKEIERLCNALNESLKIISKALEYVEKTQMDEGYKKELINILKENKENE